MNKFNIRRDSIIKPVPIEFYNDYRQDAELADRDFGAKVSRSVSKFIRDIALIQLMFDPEMKSPWDENRNFYDWFRPKPDVFYHAHVDLAKNDCRCGVSLGHQEDVYTVIDFAEAIDPRFEAGGEIDFEDVRLIFKSLEARGFEFDITFDSFQSLVGDTLVLTKYGHKPISDVLIGDYVYNSKRKCFRKIHNKWCHYAPTYKLITKHGYEIEGSEKHRIKALNTWGYSKGKKIPLWEWKRFDKFKRNDIVAIWHDPIKHLGSFNVPEVDSMRRDYFNFGKNDNSIAMLLGYLLGDGGITDRGPYVVCSSSEEDELRNFIIKTIGFCPSGVHKKGSVRFGFGTSLTKWLNDLGFYQAISNELTIPVSIMKAPSRIVKNFLGGLISADGHVSKDDGGVYFCSSSIKLIQQVQYLLLTEFGLKSCITEHGHGCGRYKESDYYTLSITGSRKRMAEIPLIFKNKYDRIVNNIDRPGRIIYEKIDNIIYSKTNKPVYDIEIDVYDPSFIANGFISHNSFDSIQQFRRMGIEASLFSVDKDIRAYTSYRRAIYDRTIRCYYNEILFNETRDLDRIDFDKVDHPDSGTKDLSDAVAAVTHHCMEEQLREIR